MKSVKILIAVFSILIFTATAYAGEMIGNQALYEKLKEKGVLTDEDVSRLLKDDKSGLELGGRFEFAYRNSEGDGPVLPTAGFQFRSVRLEVKSRISPIAYVEIDPEFTNTSVAHLESAFIAIISGTGELKLGQHHVPANLETMTSDKYLSFTERNLTSSLSPARQVGASWQQYLLDKKIWYQFGAYNGYLQYPSVANGRFSTASGSYKIYGIANSATGYANDNTALMYAGRIEWHPLGNIGSGIHATQENFSGATGVAFGMAYYASADTPLAGAAKDGITGSNSYDFDFRFRAGNLDAKAEYTIRGVQYTNALNAPQNAPQTGYTVQGSYLITPSFSLALRYDNLTVDGNNALTGPDGEKTDTWTTVGVNYYLQGHSLKVQADYIFKSEKTATATLSPNAFIAQAVYSF